MRLIIAGSRDINLSIKEIEELLKKFKIEGVTELVSGGSQGVDLCAEKWAFVNKIPVARHNANWDKYGKAAGPIRNQQMAYSADELLLIWDEESKGSASMKRAMEKEGKPIYEEIKEPADGWTKDKATEAYISYLEDKRNQVEELKKRYKEWLKGPMPDIHLYTAYSAITDVVKDLTKIVRDKK